MATHGRIGEFNPQREDWTSYTERLQEYFAANEIEEAAKQKAVLLSVVGVETYQLMRSLTAPQKPTEKSFEQLVTIVKEHHNPRPSVILQRFKFGSRKQKPGESIATFASELRRLSEHCNFGNTLDDMLRDRIVCGISDARLQRRLLAEPELTLKRALELARAQESAEQGAQQLQQQRPTSEQLNKLTNAVPRDSHRQQPLRQSERQPCHRCGGTNHWASECRFKDAECRRCRKKGHIARVGRSRVQGQPTRQQSNSSGHQRKPRQTNLVSQDTEQIDSDTSDSYEMFNIRGTQGQPYRVTVQLNNCNLEMEIDTGASLSIISDETYQSFWTSQPKPELQPTTVKLHTYTQESITVLGSITVDVAYKGQSKTLSLLVVAGQGPSLLGRNWLKELQLDWQELYQINQSEDALQALLHKHKSVFKEELGEAVGITAKLHVSTNIKPYFCRARPVPHALKSKIEQELQRLIRSHLDLVQPNLSNQVELKQEAQKQYHDRHAKSRVFEVGNKVFVKNPTSGPPWLSGHIIKIRGPVSYTVRLSDGRIMRKHVDQIRERTVIVDEPKDESFDDFWSVPPVVSHNDAQDTSRTTGSPLRRSTRVRCPPRYPDQYV